MLSLRPRRAVSARAAASRASLSAALCALLLALAGACAPTPEELEEYGQTTQFATVASLRGRAGCSSAGVEGLSAQLLDEVVCLAGGRLVSYAPHANITLTSSRVHPLLSPTARDGLFRAAARVPIRINSGFRTIAEQFVLYYSAGCGLVAIPGNSNHETGRAIDVDNYGEALGALTSNGFVHSYPSNDPVHFDGPGDDFRSLEVRAFQRLWNANHPDDRIAEDGVAGPMTLDRLGRSPADGFSIGRVCGMTTATPRLRAEFVMQSFPTARTTLNLNVGDDASGFIEMRNTGTETWMPGVTFLGTTGPRDRASQVAGADWVNSHRPATVDHPVPPGMTGRFAFTFHAPDTEAEYDEHFGLVQEGVAWFSDMGQGGPPDDLLEVRVRVGRADYGADVMNNTFPDPLVLRAGEEHEGTIEVRNTGRQSWTPGATFLATTEPRDRDSDVAQDGWLRANRVASVTGTVASGERYVFRFRVRGPARPGEYVEHFGLVQDGVAWFGDMGQGGPDDDAIMVRVQVEPEMGGDPDGGTGDAGHGGGIDGGHGMPHGGCGCAVPGSGGRGRGERRGAAVLGLCAIAAGVARRRRARVSRGMTAA